MVTDPGHGVLELRSIHLHLKKFMCLMMRQDCLLQKETALSVIEAANKLLESASLNG